MPNSAIWLLVSDQANSEIYLSHQGCSELLRTISIGNSGQPPVTSVAYPRDRLSDYAFKVMAAVHEGVEAGLCTGVVIFATREMMPALRRLTTLAVARVLIAEIVDPAGGTGTRLHQPFDAGVKRALTALAERGEPDGGRHLFAMSSIRN